MTPQELLAQSQEMLSLQGDYENLFKQSETLLNRVNENWSATLANNFSGKILSAQKSFRQISTMLGSGGNLAAESARTYESVDSLLAKNINGDGGSVAGTIGAAVAAGAAAGAAVGAGAPMRTGTAAGMGADIVVDNGPAWMVDNGPAWMAESVSLGISGSKNSVWDKFLEYAERDVRNVGEAWKTAGEALQDVSDWYGGIPENVRTVLDDAMDAIIPSQVQSSYQITKDIVTGDVSWDTAKTAGKAILGGTKFAVFKDAFEYALNEDVFQKEGEYQTRIFEEARKGNVVSCVATMVGDVVDVLGGGIVRGAGAVAAREISKIPGVGFLEKQFGFDLEKSVKSTIDKGQQYVSDRIDEGLDALSKAEETAKEFIKDTADAVGKEAQKVWSAAGEGLSKAKDTIKGLFKW